MTVEEFISEYQDGKRAMKQKEDELEFANKLLEKLREENKDLKGNVVQNLDEELNQQLEKKRKLAEMMNVTSMTSKWTDTFDLTAFQLKDDSPSYEYGGEDPEKLKEKIADLSQKLQEARGQIKSLLSEREKINRSAQEPHENSEEQVSNSAVREPISRAEDFEVIDERLKRYLNLNRLLDQIQDEQRQYIEAGDNSIADRIKKIQGLVYHFLHNIVRRIGIYPGYLLSTGRLRDSDRSFLDSLIAGLRNTGGKPRDIGGLGDDPELAQKLRDAYETISKLEKKNFYLLEILEGMRNTYDFFESATDQKVLSYGKPPQENIFKQAY